MANEQIILTQYNYGVELKVQFLDNKKKPVPMEANDTCEISIVYPDKTKDSFEAYSISPQDGIWGFILGEKQTTQVGLSFSYWSIVDENNNITAQEGLTYYTLAKDGGVPDVLSYEDNNSSEGFKEIAKEVIDARKGKDNLLAKIDEIDDKINTQLNINSFVGSTKEEKLLNMIRYAIQNNHKKVLVPNGEYNFTGILQDTILLPDSFEHIVIEGENTRKTIFNYSGAISNKPFIKVRGGSGRLSMSYIKNISFIGNDTTTAIENNNVCGFKAINCYFGTNKIGILNHNTEDGFTEFCQAVDCDFSINCLTSFEYKKTGTQRSFHGTGMINCTINQNELNTNIKIGTDCLPYNAPMTIKVWTRGDFPFIVNNGNNSTSFEGAITCERFTGKSGFVGGNTIYFNGTFLAHSENDSLGMLILCDYIRMDSDGSVNVIRKPFTVVKQLITNGSTNIKVINDCETMICDLRISKSNVEYNATLLCFKGMATNDGKVTILSVNRDFNASALNISFSINNSLIVTGNFESNNCKLSATFTQIGNRGQYFIEQ